MAGKEHADMVTRAAFCGTKFQGRDIFGMDLPYVFPTSFFRDTLPVRVPCFMRGSSVRAVGTGNKEAAPLRVLRVACGRRDSAEFHKKKF